MTCTILLALIATADPVPPEARQLVETYFKATPVDRHRYVKNGNKLKDQMEKFYGDQRFTGSESSIQVRNLTRIEGIGAIVEIDGASVSRCYLKQVNGKWLVDWPATAGVNPISVKTFTATVPKDETTMRMRAQLSDYFNFQYSRAKGSHYSIDLQEPSGDRNHIHGYVAKQTRLGDELLAILQDGKRHDIAVTIQATGREGSVVSIVRLDSNNFFLSDPEEEAEKRAEKERAEARRKEEEAKKAAAIKAEQQRKEQEVKKAEAAKKEREKTETDEATASQKYKAARELISRGNVEQIEQAKKDLAELIRLHPRTESAKKAKTLLDAFR